MLQWQSTTMDGKLNANMISTLGEMAFFYRAMKWRQIWYAICRVSLCHCVGSCCALILCECCESNQVSAIDFPFDHFIMCAIWFVFGLCTLTTREMANCHAKWQIHLKSTRYLYLSLSLSLAAENEMEWNGRAPKPKTSPTKQLSANWWALQAPDLTYL